MWPVFRKAFYDSRQTLIWLVVGLGLYAVFVASIFPTIAENADQYDEILDSMPDSMMGMIGAEDGMLDFSNPIDYANVEFMVWTVLILGAIVMMQAFNAVTNPERDGLMDVLMALPVTRRAMLMGRFLNTVVTLLIVLTGVFVTFLASTLVWPEFDVSAGDLALMIYGALLILLPYASFSYALTAFVPSSKKWAGSVAYALFFGMYLVWSLSSTNDVLSSIRPLLLFEYYNGASIVRHGFDVGETALMAALTVLFVGLAWWQIDRKELGV